MTAMIPKNHCHCCHHHHSTNITSKIKLITEFSKAIFIHELLIHKCHTVFIILKNLLMWIVTIVTTFPSVTNDISYSALISLGIIYSLYWSEYILNHSESGALHLVSPAFYWKDKFQSSKWAIMAQTFTITRRINENQSHLAYKILLI
jgi:hypothetical protein